MKKFLWLVAFMALVPIQVHAAEPVMAVLEISYDTPRLTLVAGMIRNHLQNIVNTVGDIGQVKSDSFSQQLRKYDCVEDSCVSRVSADAGIDIIVRGHLRDNGDTVQLELYAFATHYPYYGKIVASHKVDIPLKGLNIGAREYSYITEEHAGRFLSRLFREYQYPVTVNPAQQIAEDDVADGSYEVFEITGDRMNPSPAVVTGQVRIRSGKVTITDGNFGSNPVVLRRYTSQAEFLDEYYKGRKRELVLPPQDWESIPYALVVTPLLSATMMLTAPVGYYSEGDYAGLGLWAVNTAPYTWTMWRGLTNRVSVAEDNHEDISRRQSADYYFGLYYLFAGGVSLFTDAAAGYGLRRASNYQGRQEFLGDNYTAAVLTLAGGGAGHFYKGYRGWGYFYFHLNNTLMYSSLYLWSGNRSYNAETGKYDQTGQDRRQAMYVFGALGVIKTIEMVHMLLTPVQLENGTEYAGRKEPAAEVVPVFFPEKDSGRYLGLCFRQRF